MLYGRKCSIKIGDNSNGVDVAGFKCVFQVMQSTIQSPTWCNLRIYNLSEDTVRAFIGWTLVIDAGYEEQYGTIFTGDIIQMASGRENATDTYIDIVAGDGLIAYTKAVLNKTILPPYTAKDLFGVALDSMKPYGVFLGGLATLPGTEYSRPRVLYGSTKDYLRELADQHGCDWGIDQGKLYMTPAAPDVTWQTQAVELNGATGLIGTPRQTLDGINMVCLLNPAISGRPNPTWIHLDNAVLANQMRVPPTRTADVYLREYQNPGLGTNLPETRTDGFYWVMSASHTGDTRGGEWHTHIIAAARGSRWTPYRSQVFRNAI